MALLFCPRLLLLVFEALVHTCSVPSSVGLGEWFEEIYYPFSHLCIPAAQFFVVYDKDSKDVGVGFLSGYLKGTYI